MSILQTPIINTSNPIEPQIQEYLPTPQISVVGVKDKGLWKNIDNRSWRFNDEATIRALTYSADYYKVLLDVYLNSFGQNAQFLQMPDLKLELCRVSNKKQSGWSNGNIKNLMGLNEASFNSSQKDYGVTKIVHSASLQIGGNPGDTVINTKYSGGNGTFDVTEFNFPDSSNNGRLNKYSNPSVRVEIDLKNYFKSSNGNYGSNTIFPVSANNGEWFYVRGTHSTSIPKQTNSIQTLHQYYLRNAVFFFRLSAGNENSWNESKQRYDERIYSDLSMPIYFQPVVRKFYETAGDNNSASNSIIYHYKIGLGNKV